MSFEQGKKTYITIGLSIKTAPFEFLDKHMGVIGPPEHINCRCAAPPKIKPLSSIDFDGYVALFPPVEDIASHDITPLTSPGSLESEYNSLINPEEPSPGSFEAFKRYVSDWVLI